MAAFNVETCVRPNILALQPYHCARGTCEVDGEKTLLDLKENAYGPALPGSISGIDLDIVNPLQLHRYSDRLQRDLKQRLCDFRNTHAHTDRDLVNDVRVVEAPLLAPPTFSLDVLAISRALSNDPTIKLANFASPAYINFAGYDASLAGLALEYPSLVVLHTLSKAFGQAGARLGAAYVPIPIARLLDNIKTPWNIPSPTSVLACSAVSQEGIAVMRQNRNKVTTQMN
ncbi:Imidazole acetol-phosphate transaminase [Fusarium sp. Ph1]|nr:Imidazole acetol-phosphate transaminase [Fusarium sp. Ph1]